MWLRVVRNNDLLCNLAGKAEEMFGQEATSEYRSKTVDCPGATNKLKCVLSSSGYLRGQERVHRSMATSPKKIGGVALKTRQIFRAGLH